MWAAGGHYREQAKSAESLRQIKGRIWRKNKAGTSPNSWKAPLCGERGLKSGARPRKGWGRVWRSRGRDTAWRCAAGEPKPGAVAPCKDLHGHGGESPPGPGAPETRSGECGAEARGRPPAGPPRSPRRGAGGDRTQTLSSPRPRSGPATAPARLAPPRAKWRRRRRRPAEPYQELQHGARLLTRPPACLPGKSGGRRLLFRVPARPHRRPWWGGGGGRGPSTARPPAPLGRLRGLCPAGSPPGGRRLGRPVPAALGDKEPHKGGRRAVF